MSSVSFSGLASGLDSATIVRQLLTVERQPITRLERRKSVETSKAAKLSSMQSKLQALRDAARALDTPAEARKLRATSSDSTVVAASVTGAPLPGVTSVHVASLAQREHTYSDGFAAADQPGLFGNGTLTITVGGTPVTVSVTDGDTLESVATKIGQSGAPVTAATVYTGSAWRLRISGTGTGTAAAIDLDETAGLALGLSDPANEAQAATDARFVVDGIEMTRSTNVVTDLVPGVTLSLTGVSPTAAPATITVENDSAGSREALSRFVDAYNEVARALNGELGSSSGARPVDSLASDSALRRLQQTLRSVVGAAVPGTSDPYRTLASIGVSTGRDGSLSLDAAALERALAADASAVTRLVAGDGAAVVGVMDRLESAIDGFVDRGGVLPSRIETHQKRSREIDGQIDRLEARIEKTAQSLRAQFAALEQLVAGMKSQGDRMLAAFGGLQ